MTSAPSSSDKLPIGSLLALSTAAFLAILTETMPAAVLPLITADLNWTEAQVGLLVGAYASGSAATAIPLIAATRSLPRRMLFLTALAVFCLTSIAVVYFSNYTVILAARVAAGVMSGVIWSMVAGYAVRLSTEQTMGRAIAIAMTGSAVAMAAGLPLGSFVGTLLGWRASFGLLALLSLGLIGWVLVAIPPAPAAAKHSRASVRGVAMMPGLMVVLAMAGVAMLGHYTLYTYIAPLAIGLALPGGTTAGLALFGVGAVGGVVLAGRVVDRHLRGFALSMLTLTFALMITSLLFAGNSVIGVTVMLLWGLSFGGMPTVIQSGVSRIVREESELGTAMIATIYNVGIFAGSAVGGTALAVAGLSSLFWIVGATMLVSGALVYFSRRHGFAATQP
ncbi:MFS transporter [Thioclava sp. BHET1]|nr:MFS transporter [Thioclava sp. BHET1]